MEQPPPYSPDGQHPPQQGYAPPPNTGYPPQPAPYPPQQQPGYPPQGGGYPPQNPAGYPPQKPVGYPPQNPAGYPPQGQGYPPQGQGYVQQPAGFSSQSTNNTTVVVVGQSQPQVVTAVVPVVHDQMGLSIFACLCCFWPVGIFAIMKSSEARNRHMAGDYSGAITSAQTARYLAWAAILCGVIIYVLVISIESAK